MSLFGLEYRFADEWVLWFLLIIPLLIVLYAAKGKEFRTFIKVGFIPKGFLKGSVLDWLPHFNFSLVILALGSFIMALARPQVDAESESITEQYREGIDIMISLDASGSMNAQDFKPDRFQAAKAVAQNFAKDRVNDRLGLVIFEGEAFTQCPLSSDKQIVTELIGEAEQEMVSGGTAIGMGLATAINRLKESTTESKIIILLTDGVNSHGNIHPLEAAEIAKKFGIRVYTIGIGKQGKAKMPVGKDFGGRTVYDYIEVEIDEDLLKQIAKTTGGKYFRATNNDALSQVYKEIDKLEKDKIETIEYELDLPERSMPFILFGLVCMGIIPIINLLSRRLV